MKPESCPECGSPLSEDGNVCPRCAMSLALGTISESGDDSAPEANPDSPAGSLRAIGPYRLIRRLGIGGMGEVWLAEQHEPVQRKVALKIVKPGLGGDALVARFESERRAMARMEHPAIARVLDAGATESGQPYLAMEYVRGEPITRYAETHKLSTRQRLQLFRQVCDGVQHAHQKAMVHRDLKPSNILVTEQDGLPLPKIIDFGVAKAIDPGPAGEPRFTEQGVLLGTPEYMSPEQARADGTDIDTRTDVYSLGVVLYELLAGTLPLDSKELRRAGYEELLRKIRESEPVRPSDRVTDTASLSRTLRGDLDWITMKALDKEPARRYDSPAELGRDIDRYLLDEPVSAGPPSAGYRARKFVRRHRTGVAAAALVATVAVAGFAGTAYGLIRATRSEAEARRDAAIAGNISSFMTGLFEVSNPSEARGNSITAREILDQGVKQIGDSLEDDPETRGRLMSTMGGVYLNLGLLEESKTLLEESLAILESSVGSVSDEALDIKAQLGGVYMEQGDLEASETITREVLEGRLRLHGENNPSTAMAMGSVGAIDYTLGNFEDAERLMRQRLEILQRLGATGDSNYIIALSDIGAVLRAQGKPAEAAPFSRKALDKSIEILGPDHPDTLDTWSSYGNSMYALGQTDDAEEAFRTATEGARRVLGEDHPWTLLYASNLVATLTDNAKYEDAESQARLILAARSRTLGEDHVSTNITREVLGVTLQRMGRLEEAEEILLIAVGEYLRIHGPEHPITLNAKNNLAAVYHQMPNLESAGRLYTEAYQGLKVARGENAIQTLTAAGNLADVWREEGRLSEAMELIEDTMQRVRENVGPEHPLQGYTLGKYGDCLVDAKRYEEAEPILLSAYQQLIDSTNEQNYSLGSVVLDLIQLYEETDRPDKVAEWTARKTRD